MGTLIASKFHPGWILIRCKLNQVNNSSLVWIIAFRCGVTKFISVFCFCFKGERTGRVNEKSAVRFGESVRREPGESLVCNPSPNPSLEIYCKLIMLISMISVIEGDGNKKYTMWGGQVAIICTCLEMYLRWILNPFFWPRNTGDNCYLYHTSLPNFCWGDGNLPPACTSTQWLPYKTAMASPPFH